MLSVYHCVCGRVSGHLVIPTEFCGHVWAFFEIWDMFVQHVHFRYVDIILFICTYHMKYHSELFSTLLSILEYPSFSGFLIWCYVKAQWWWNHSKDEMRTWCGDSETQAVLRRDEGEKANGRTIEILNQHLNFCMFELCRSHRFWYVLIKACLYSFVYVNIWIRLLKSWSYGIDTVDGRNPAPVDMVNIPLFTRLHTCWVVQDFFQQYYDLSRGQAVLGYSGPSCFYPLQTSSPMVKTAQAGSVCGDLQRLRQQYPTGGGVGRPRKPEKTPWYGGWCWWVVTPTGRWTAGFHVQKWRFGSDHDFLSFRGWFLGESR